MSCIEFSRYFHSSEWIHKIKYLTDIDESFLADRNGHVNKVTQKTRFRFFAVIQLRLRLHSNPLNGALFIRGELKQHYLLQYST